MPLYEYECLDCEGRFEAKRSVDERDDGADCPYCFCGIAKRVFDPGSVTLSVPAHFALKHLCAGWHLPRNPETGKVDYSDLCRPGEIRKSPETGEKEFAEHLEREVLGRERITLSSGGGG